MRKDDLHIEIKIDPPPQWPSEEELARNVAESVRAFRQLGVSVATAGATLGSAAPYFVKVWQEMVFDVQYRHTINHVEQHLSGAFTDSFTRASEVINSIIREIERAERKAQQRAQLILLLAFILLTMLVGLL